MELTVKSFDELNTFELYNILKARSAVFVVEQNCPYQDIDDIDKRSLHMYFETDGSIDAYLRVFEKEKGVVQIGRVLTTKRGQGLGGKLLHEAVQVISDRYNCKKMYLEAQTYAIGFYEKEGFEVCSREFLEDNIPHVRMEKHL